jgi:drug/metabolite transporter (DMT)-like permease
VTVRKYLVLAAVIVFGSCGDVCLGRGMRDFGPVTGANWHLLLGALRNPWIILGICFLLGFFCTYITALSWADLTYVLPATAFSYVLMVLLAKIFLHEAVPASHWLGVALITVGVGFVATGPPLTVGPDGANRAPGHGSGIHNGETRSDA